MATRSATTPPSTRSAHITKSDTSFSPLTWPSANTNTGPGSSARTAKDATVDVPPEPTMSIMSEVATEDMATEPSRPGMPFVPVSPSRPLAPVEPESPLVPIPSVPERPLAPSAPLAPLGPASPLVIVGVAARARLERASATFARLYALRARLGPAMAGAVSANARKIVTAAIAFVSGLL